MPERIAFIVALFLLVTVLAFLGIIVRGILYIWCDYCIKRRFLQWLAEHPDKVRGTEDIPQGLEQFSSRSSHELRQNFAITGVVLAAFGLMAVAAAYGLRVGNIAVGLYIGGLVCLVAGGATALFAGIARYIRTWSR